jgi:hypothetical protein
MLGLRAAALMVPMVVLSFGGCGSRTVSAAIGSAAAVLVTFLVSRGGVAGRAVAPGMLAGVASLGAPLVACRVLEQANAPGWLPFLACILGGLAAGGIVTRFAVREPKDRVRFLLAAGAVNALAGSLGCVEVGAGGVAAMVLGFVVIAPLSVNAAPRSAG